MLAAGPSGCCTGGMFAPPPGLTHNVDQFYSAIFKAQLGKAQLTSLTAYSVNSGYQSIDDTWDYGPISAAVFGADVTGAKDLDQSLTDKFSQEVRLSLPVSDWLDWLAGLYYTHEDTRTIQDIWGADETTGLIEPAWNFLAGHWQTTLDEEAVFTNLTFHLTDKFDVQLGGRESQNRQTYSEVDGGGFSSIFWNTAWTHHQAPHTLGILCDPRGPAFASSGIAPGTSSSKPELMNLPRCLVA